MVCTEHLLQVDPSLQNKSPRTGNLISPPFHSVQNEKSPISHSLRLSLKRDSSLSMDLISKFMFLYIDKGALEEILYTFKFCGYIISRLADSQHVCKLTFCLPKTSILAFILCVFNFVSPISREISYLAKLAS